MIDLKTSYIENLEQLYNEYSQAITYLKSDAKDKKTKAKNIERMNDLLVKLIKQTDDIYSIDYNTILGLETSTIDEELERLKNLRDIVDKRKKYVNGFLLRHKKGTSVDLSQQFESIIKGNDLDTIEEKIEIIDHYVNNCNEISHLKEKVAGIDEALSLIYEHKEQSLEHNKNLDNSLNSMITSLLDKNNLSSYSVSAIETRYLEYKELYDKLKDRVSGSEKLDYLTASLSNAERDFKEYNALYHMLKLKEMTNFVEVDCNEAISKREEIKSIINNMKGHEVEIQLRYLVEEQMVDLNKQKEELELEIELQNDKNDKNKRLEELEKENNREEVVNLVYRFNEDSDYVNSSVSTIVNPDVSFSEIVDGNPNQIMKKEVLPNANLILSENYEKASSWVAKASEVVGTIKIRK